jgi:hypothetical protein
MISQYPDDIRNWITTNPKGVSVTSWLTMMPHLSFWVLSAEQLWEMGYRKC